MKNRTNGSSSGKPPVEPLRHDLGAEKAASTDGYARRLVKEHGPIIVIGPDWRQWQPNTEGGGIWRSIDKDKFLGLAYDIQAGNKSNKAAINVVDSMRMICQKSNPENFEWRGAIGFKNEHIVIINVLNGVVRVDLEKFTIELIEADPSHYATAQLPLRYNPEAKCEVFDKILSTTLPDAANRLKIQCFIGYCFLPDTRHQCVLHCYGRAHSGKSLLIEHAIGSMFGKQLMSLVSLAAICDGKDELRALEGSLLNVGDEIDERELKNSAIFNKLACCEELDAALKYDRTRRIRPACKFIYIGNHLPRWHKGSEAQARRIKILEFDQNFKGQPEDDKLKRAVMKEHSGIFNWALRGLIELIKLGVMPVGSIGSQKRQQEFVEGNDPMRAFVDKYIIFDRKAVRALTSTEFEKGYRRWADNNGYQISEYQGGPVGIFCKLYSIKKRQLRDKGQRHRYLLGVRMDWKILFEVVTEDVTNLL